MKLDLKDAVKGVAAKNKIMIKKIPHPNSEDEKFMISLISLLFIWGNRWEVTASSSAKAKFEFVNHWLRKKKIKSIRGTIANKVKKDIDAFRAMKLCRWHPSNNSIMVK